MTSLENFCAASSSAKATSSTAEMRASNLVVPTVTKTTLEDMGWAKVLACSGAYYRISGADFGNFTGLNSLGLWALHLLPADGHHGNACIVVMSCRRYEKKSIAPRGCSPSQQTAYTFSIAFLGWHSISRILISLIVTFSCCFAVWNHSRGSPEEILHLRKESIPARLLAKMTPSSFFAVVRKKDRTSPTERTSALTMSPGR